jgi:type VI secretion system protein ImpC
VSPDAPFHLCVIGDFGGAPDVKRRAIEIDRDNFDDVLDRSNIVFECEMPEGQPPASVRFRTLDDFHPDQLFEAVEAFESLRQTRRKLLNPATFAQAADEVRSWLPDETAPTPVKPAPKPAAPVEPINTAGLLDGILDAADSAPAQSGEIIDWNSMIREIVRPYSIPAVDPQQDVLVSCVDAVIGRMMTALLHHPRFRTLEAAWRGLWLLVRRLETDSRLKVFLLDVPHSQLDSVLNLAGDLRAAPLYRELVERTVGTPGADPWAVLLGLYEFGSDELSSQRLARLAELAAASSAPFIAAATGEIPGCVDGDWSSDPADWQPAAVSDDWRALRSSPAAEWVALIWPSFALRLPYGPRTSPTEVFAFNEIPGKPQMTDYLWGSPAVIAGCLFGQSYTESGWRLRIGEQSEVSGLPQHIYKDDDDSIARPCAAVQLTETGAQQVIECGINPLWAVRNQDTVQLPALKSLAGGELAARWSR